MLGVARETIRNWLGISNGHEAKANNDRRVKAGDEASGGRRGGDINPPIATICPASLFGALAAWSRARAPCRARSARNPSGCRGCSGTAIKWGSQTHHASPWLPRPLRRVGLHTLGG